MVYMVLVFLFHTYKENLTDNKLFLVNVMSFYLTVAVCNIIVAYIK